MISIDGIVRTNRDVWETAVEAANLLKNLNPYSKVVIHDRKTGVTTEIERSKTAGRTSLAYSAK